jgi:hypothetical protein
MNKNYPATRRFSRLVRFVSEARVGAGGPGIYKHVVLATLLILLTTLAVVIYYDNHPAPEPLADTWSYLYAVDRIQAHGQIVNFWRLPGYPLFIVLIYSLAGQGNLGAVSTTQAVLFVLSTLELYLLANLVFHRAWIAFLASLLIGINIPLLSYVKPVMSEALALWLLTSLALGIVLFLSTFSMRLFWLVTLCTLLLFCTRPEWIYLPIPLFAYLLLAAAWRGRPLVLRLLPHVLAAMVLLYAVLGGYIYVNATQNHFPGVTWIQNINELGKVLQYHMQDEAPPQYARISRMLDQYVAKGMLDPYLILAKEPELARNDAALAGAFSQTVIEHHPVEFLVKSASVFFSSLMVFYEESRIVPTAPFGHRLLWLDAQFRALYKWDLFFPLCAALWLFLLLWPRARASATAQAMGALLLLCLYGLISTTLGAYRGYDYMRLHTLFDPLLTLVIWGTLLLGGSLLVRRGPEKLMNLTQRSLLRRRITLATATLLLFACCLAGLALFVARWQFAPGLSSLIGVVFFFALSTACIASYIQTRWLK